MKKGHSALEDGVQCAGQHDDEEDEVVVNDPLDVLGSLAPDHIWVKFVIFVERVLNYSWISFCHSGTSLATITT